MKEIGICIVPSRLEEDLKVVERILANDIRTIGISDYHKAGNPFKLFKVINSKFEGMFLGFCVTNFISRDPIDIIDFMYGCYLEGRNSLFLGIGAGDWYLLKDYKITPKEALERLKKGIKLVQEKFSELKINIPIYIGCQGRSTIKLVGEVEGGILNLANVTDIKKALEIFPKDKEIMSIAQTFIGDNSCEYARKAALIIYAGLSDSSLELYGFDRTKRDLLRNLILRGEIEEARKKLSLSDVERLTLCGPIYKIKSRVEEILELVDKFIIGLPLGEERFSVLNELSHLKPIK